MIVLPYTVAIFPSQVSINGISGFASANCAFGSVYQINDSCYKFKVGDAVGFKTTEAMIVTIATKNFYLIDQEDVKFIQTPPSMM